MAGKDADLRRLCLDAISDALDLVIEHAESAREYAERRGANELRMRIHLISMAAVTRETLSLYELMMRKMK